MSSPDDLNPDTPPVDYTNTVDPAAGVNLAPDQTPTYDGEAD